MRTAKSLKKKATRRRKGAADGSFEKHKGAVPVFANKKEINAWLDKLRGGESSSERNPG
jgi:hypothetical protein